MNPVDTLLAELRGNPERFCETDGYERLLRLLRNGIGIQSMSDAVRTAGPLAADLLWTVCELESTEPYASAAAAYVRDSDKATAAYAVEAVLRGSRRQEHIRGVFEGLRDCADAVREHATLVLARLGLGQLAGIFELAGWAWASLLVAQLQKEPLRHETVERLLATESVDCHIVAALLVTLAGYENPVFLDQLRYASSSWIRHYAERLSRLRH